MARQGWFGHVKRMKEGRVAKIWPKSEIMGKIRVGRSHKKWMCVIKQDIMLKRNQLQQVEEEKYGQGRWRRLVSIPGRLEVLN